MKHQASKLNKISSSKSIKEEPKEDQLSIIQALFANRFQQYKASTDDFEEFCQNSIVLIDELSSKKQITAFVPAYVRTHFRNMTEMDIQNLSCRFIATMNISFYLGMYNVEDDKQQKEKVKEFAKLFDEYLRQNLKVTFQNDFVLDIKEDMSTNVSDSDRTIRSTMSEYKFNKTKRIYTTFIITRQFKFGLRSDILFFPLEQNDLDLVTTLNPIKINLQSNKLTIKFNCMNIQMTSKQTLKNKGLTTSQVENEQLLHNLKDLYMQQYDGKQLNQQILQQQYMSNKNNPFFRSIKISFPQKPNSTQFGYYYLVQNQIQIHYTRQKQNKFQSNFYQRLKNCLFCRKKIYNYKAYAQNRHEEEASLLNHQEDIDTEDRSLEDSYCNSIMRIPMLKASLGTIIQLCIPIFFLSFLSLVQFLYSQSTSGDVVRGLKIGSSTLIVATYINFIYAMRSVIPPTPSWSIFQIAVSILAATSLLPIIESIYAGSYQNYENPFLTQNGLFIAAFIIETILCLLIIIMLVGIKFFKDNKTKRASLINVKMDDLVDNLTKKYFFVWRNSHCYDDMRKLIDKKPLNKRIVWFERWRKSDHK